MILDLTDREAAMLTAMLTSASILSAHSTDIYKDAYGPLLGKLLNQREQQERRGLKNVP